MSEYPDYHLLVPTERASFNTCFYCGCIASEHDFAPPLKYRDFFLSTQEPADFVKIPSCRECFEHLKSCKAGALEERRVYAKKKLAKKYEKALNIFEMWTEEELAALDFSLSHSIAAGLKLGLETTERLNFPGFNYEAAGINHQVHYHLSASFDVFGESYSSFREALDYASKAYRIPKFTLKEYYAEHGNSFEKAIHAVHRETAAKEFQKQLTTLCQQFAKQHKQSVIFVHKQVERYLTENDTLSISQALGKLYDERIHPAATRKR
ncbi:hypothetical protein JAO78_013595 [Alishewanella sp. 16-MA]|uniref:Uncharacterized protein n=1 Tax=Alishewanella maricola TaxID=2795740 RepID=A0ABS8C6C0_9ALTE|nr:hypothetical protein [Alishewanella maricola]MCB5227846.1 hypothetical protein [Alishewanella maricola]